MASLYGILSISLRALLAQQAALENSSNNIANINTPGFARRQVVLEEASPLGEGAIQQPGGVNIAKIQSVRDKVLELRTLLEVQTQAKDQAIADNLSTLESLFGEGTGFIGDELSGFFNAVSSLTTDPNSLALRQSVLTAATNLASSLNKLAQGISSTQQNLDRSVVQTVASVNQMSSQIAAINLQVANKEKLGQDPGALADQRGQLLRKLSALIDLSVIDSADGLTLTTSSGSPLVVGDKSYELKIGNNHDGLSDVFSGDRNITDALTSGKLGGLIELRDRRLPDISDQLDAFTFGFANAINAVLTSGYDRDGNAGQNLCSVPAQERGAASALGVAITDPRLLAASSSQPDLDNTNLHKLLDVQNATLENGNIPRTFYSRLVFTIGEQVQDATADAEAGNLLVTQLDDQRGAISGVSLDEEAANLIRYQQAFQAAARVIDVVSQLTEIVVNLGR